MGASFFLLFMLSQFKKTLRLSAIALFYGKIKDSLATGPLF